MKLGTKIALGFVSLVGIAVLLGGMSIWNMKGVANVSAMLAEEYVPEVKVAVDLRGAANRTMYEMRGYGLSEDEHYYTQAQQEMTAVQKHLKEAAELAVNAVHLTTLQGRVAEAQSAADTYAKLMEHTEQEIAKLNTERAKLDQNAAAYMQNCSDFLDGQNRSFNTDLDERQNKVRLVTDIVNLGTQVRVLNFRAQGAKDMALMQEAANLLAELKTYTGELRPLTKRAINIEQIDKTHAAADKYAGNMAAYIKTSEALVADGTAMDENAAAYMKNCSDFLASQDDAMRAEFTKEGANLEEWLQKITTVNDIIDLGNAVRVGNFKAQALQDPKLMQEAIEQLGGVKAATADLRKMTREEANLKQIDEIERAADGYLAAMQDYLTNYLELDSYRSEMDAAAGQYVAQCEAFLKSQQEGLTRDLHERHEKITLVNNIIDVANDSRVKAFRSQATRSPAIMEEAIANFHKLDETFTALRKITRLDEDLKRIDNTKAAGERYAQGLTTFLAEWKALQDLGKQRGETGQSVITACATIADAGVKNTDEIANQSASALTSSTNVMIVGLAVAVLVGILLAFFITRSITGPIRRIIEGLNEGADQVNDAAAQVSTASQQLAEGASEQASSLEETSSALEEMAAMTRTNAENSKEANELAGQTRQAAGEGDQSMIQLNAAMAGINESSGKISKIIKVIEEIAFQTNLLALNAAVEAARAGEHGKGFAVVAEEVRNLAQRCAGAARDTTGLIEDAVQRSQQGTHVSGEVGKSLGAIVGQATKVSELINGIARASEEQAQGVDQVNTAVSQMDKVTQQNSAGAEESASAAEELSAQAQRVKGMVNELVTLVGGASERSHAPARPPAKKSVKKTVLTHAVHVGAQAAEAYPSADESGDVKDF